MSLRWSAPFALECKEAWCELILKGEQGQQITGGLLPPAACRPPPATRCAARGESTRFYQITPCCVLLPTVAGAKSIEVRTYPPPPELQGQRCWLLAAGGPDGVASFADSIAAGATGGHLVGWVLFGDSTEYCSPEQFAADEKEHHVPPGSPYALESGGTAYGWRVLASHRLPQPLPLPAMQRVTRSVYRLC